MLRIASLRVSYGRRDAIDGVDLDVRAGEFVALVGPNGCGKTTLIKAASRVVPWAGGEILAGETSLRGLGARDIARLVAVVPQGPSLPAGYTASEVVLMGRTAHLGFLDQEGPDDLRVVAASLSRVGAAHLADRPVDELSGGERQGVLLARALAQDAPVLLLDEPTANLDIGHQVSVARLIRELAASGLAVLAAIHDLTLASLYADRIALMSAGRLLAVGPPEAVLTDGAIESAYGTRVTLREGAGSRPIVLPVPADCPQGTFE
jgi:iron complex transport system ATP-binding protein